MTEGFEHAHRERTVAVYLKLSDEELKVFMGIAARMHVSINACIELLATEGGLGYLEDMGIEDYAEYDILNAKSQSMQYQKEFGPDARTR